MIPSGAISFASSSSFRLPHLLPRRRKWRQLKPAWAKKENMRGDSNSGESTFSLRVSKAVLARSAVAVFGLGFLDAGYSGDWSRIGAISKETEELLKIAAYLDVPCIHEVAWSKTSRLKDVVQQFSEHLQKLQEFWFTMDDIDRALCIVDPKESSLATSYRQIGLGNDCCLLLHISTSNPRSLPECRFFGPDSAVDLMRKNWKKNAMKWKTNSAFRENLATVLERELPGPPTSSKDEGQVDCGICYAQYLPVDDELGANSGSAPDYTCENPSCSKAFHSVCLRDWLHSITTTRQSFDVLFGKCPYCSEPVAIKVHT